MRHYRKIRVIKPTIRDLSAPSGSRGSRVEPLGEVCPLGDAYVQKARYHIRFGRLCPLGLPDRLLHIANVRARAASDASRSAG